MKLYTVLFALSAACINLTTHVSTASDRVGPFESSIADISEWFNEQSARERPNFDSVCNLIKMNKPEEAKEALRQPGFDINMHDDNGYTLLHYVVMYGHTDVARFLITNFNALDPNAQGRDGITPLWRAADYNKAEMVKILCTHPKTDLNRADKLRNRTPLAIAACNGFIDVARELLSHRNRIDVNKCSFACENTPFELACQCEHQEIMQLITEYNEHQSPEESPIQLTHAAEIYDDTALPLF